MVRSQWFKGSQSLADMVAIACYRLPGTENIHIPYHSFADLRMSLSNLDKKNNNSSTITTCFDEFVIFLTTIEMFPFLFFPKYKPTFDQSSLYLLLYILNRVVIWKWILPFPSIPRWASYKNKTFSTSFILRQQFFQWYDCFLSICYRGSNLI